MPSSRLFKLIHGLYVITDSHLTPPESMTLQVEQALKGGARVVQFRDKTNPDTLKTELALQLKALCDRYQALLLINDDLDLAQRIEADGVHIGKNDAHLAKARKQLGEQAIIGVSCYDDLQRAVAMQNLGASYVAFGRLFPSKTKPEAPPARLSTLEHAKTALTIPIVAIGGITAHNAAQPISAGADAVAVIQGVFAQADIEAAARQIQQFFA